MAVELKAIATLDGKPFEMEVTKIGNSVNKLGSGQLAGLKGMIAGAFSVGAIVSFGRSMLQTADTMKQFGDATNLDMRSMVALKTVGAENNINFDQMSRVLGKLRNAQGEVISLSAPMLDALKKLGITAEEFVGMPVDEVLEKIAKKFQESGGSASAFNAVTALFGEKIGPKMLDMLRALAEEGMVNLKKRTENAAKGFDALATAQQNYEKGKSNIEISTGMAAGGYTGFMDDIASMVYGNDPGAHKGITGLTDKVSQDTILKVLARTSGKGGAEKKQKSAVDLAIEADQKTLADNKRAAAQKAVDAELRSIEKMSMSDDDYIKEREKTINEFSEKRADLIAGKGIETPGRARVDSLQAIGGIIGGVAGQGDQAARIAERQAKTQEAIQSLMQETNAKLDELNRKMDGIISE